MVVLVVSRRPNALMWFPPRAMTWKQGCSKTDPIYIYIYYQRNNKMLPMKKWRLFERLHDRYSSSSNKSPKRRQKGARAVSGQAEHHSRGKKLVVAVWGWPDCHLSHHPGISCASKAICSICFISFERLGMVSYWWLSYARNGAFSCAALRRLFFHSETEEWYSPRFVFLKVNHCEHSIVWCLLCFHQSKWFDMN